jgi:RimJ/RimL family protein N-acetyltransferase
MTSKPFFMETERLWLRSLREEDCAVMVDYLNHPDVVLPLVSPPYPFSYSDAMEFYRKMHRATEAGHPEFFVLADKTTDEMIGGIGIHAEHTLDKRPFVGEIGYWLGRPYWGQGYIREALPKLFAFAFDVLGLNRLVATTNTDNTRSHKVLKDMGFAYLGVFTPLKPPKRGTPQVTSWELTREAFERQIKP